MSEQGQLIQHQQRHKHQHQQYRTLQRPKVLGMYDGLDSGCSFYRLISPYAQLVQMGRVYDWLSLADEKDAQESSKLLEGASYELVNLLRPIIVETGKENEPVDEQNLELIQAMVDRVHGAGALFGGDLDDDMWSIAEHNPAQKTLGPYAAERIRLTLKGMDFVTCSTPYLKKRIIEVTGLEPDRVEVVPNLIDFDLFDRSDWTMEIPAPNGGKGKSKGKGQDKPKTEQIQLSMPDIRRRRLSAVGPDLPNKPVVIGIQGGKSHVEDWRQVAPALKRIAERYGGRVRFVVAGADFDYLKEALSGADKAGLVWWKGWTPFLKHSETVMSFDINLCPLEPTLFNRSKSAIKWLEGCAAGAASVVSPTVYGEYAQPGLTALVAKEPGDWFEAISFLLENPEQRREIGRNAHLVARSSYSLSANAYLWHNAYSDFYRRYGGKIRDNRMQLAELKEIQDMEAFRQQQQQQKQKAA